MYRSRPIALLRIALALVMGYGAARILVPFAPGVHAGLGLVELLAAILFLIPGTLRVGAWLLAASLVFATLIHLHTGQPPSPVFLVYAAGIYAVVAEPAA